MCLFAVVLGFGCGGDDDAPEADAMGPSDPGSLALVGHSDLMGRGMNSALAIIGDHAYVGSRTDGVVHEQAGVMIVDISDPSAPTVVGEIGYPDEAVLGVSSRELRAVPDKNLLIVLNFHCSRELHACRNSNTSYPLTGGAEEADNLKLYDVSNPTAPQLVATYDFMTHPGAAITAPHEFFLWRDPSDTDRILLYFSMPVGPPALQVLDISDLQDMKIIATFDPENDAGLEEPRSGDALLHSVGVSAAGDVAYISYQGAGLMLADTSQIAAGMAAPVISLVHPVENRVDWTPPEPAGVHSAVEVPGRDLVVVTDEIYPAPVFPGCPWGWTHLVDFSDDQNPRVASEYKVAQNEPSFCEAEGGPDYQTFTAHNATATANLALISWHSAGLEVVDISDAENPAHMAAYVPEPIGSVATEDPMLGGNPVLMWSYPIIRDGLIYVTDIRNGLYILRYTGPHDAEIASTAFGEGNSNID